jgi:hypothetical protein
MILILSLALSGLAALYYSNILTATPDIVVINQTPDNNTTANMKNTSTSSIKITSSSDNSDKSQKSDNSEETKDKSDKQRNST